MRLTAILFSLFSIAVGLFIFFKPSLTIEIQRRCYEMINWRIEPISMPKEIRNTRIMGMFLSTVSVIALIYLLFN